MTLQQAAAYQNLFEEIKPYEFSFWFALLFDIFLYCIPVGSFADRCDMLAIGPKLTTPQLFLYRWVMSKYFTGCNALEYLHYSAWRYLWMGTAEQVNMVFVATYGFHFDGISLGNSRGCLLYDVSHFGVQQSLSVFQRKYNMVVDLPSTMVAFSNRFV